MKALVSRWLNSRDEDDRGVVGGWIEDYFYRALDWVLKQVGTKCDKIKLKRFHVMNYTE